jgi:hypothetical protein
MRNIRKDELEKKKGGFRRFFLSKQLKEAVKSMKVV